MTPAPASASAAGGAGREDPGRPRRVLLTGATGNLGRPTLREFARRADRFEVTALVLPTPREREVIRGFADLPNLRVVWGDLTDAPVVAHAVRGVDVVVHAGGVISPEADEHPERAHRVNVEGMRNLVAAVRGEPDPSRVAVIGVGTVAQTGSRNPPVHWGRVGDPQKVAHIDPYGLSKVIAERELVDSGLPRWVQLRWSGILHAGMLAMRDPIMTRTPLGGVMEWVSDEDSAHLLVNACEPDVPDALWGRVFDVGGGAGWRLTNWQLQVALGAAMGVDDVRGWFDRDWFALRDFHGMWYTDSDDLEALVPFRHERFEAALDRIVREAPASARQAGRVPAWAVKRFVMRPLAKQPRGMLGVIRRGDEGEVAAYFGSLERWRAIGDWSTFVPAEPSREPAELDHGYDESVPPSRWSLADLAGFAGFRGGRLVSADAPPRDAVTPLLWTCAFGHEFWASPRLVLSAGHWCPECLADPYGYERQAEHDRLLAQVVDG